MDSSARGRKSGVPAAIMPQITSKTDRLMARIAFVILAAGALYGTVMFGRPLYYRFAADVLRPFGHGDPGGGRRALSPMQACFRGYVTSSAHAICMACCMLGFPGVHASLHACVFVYA